MYAVHCVTMVTLTPVTSFNELPHRDGDRWVICTFAVSYQVCPLKQRWRRFHLAASAGK